MYALLIYWDRASSCDASFNNFLTELVDVSSHPAYPLNLTPFWPSIGFGDVKY